MGNPLEIIKKRTNFLTLSLAKGRNEVNDQSHESNPTKPGLHIRETVKTWITKFRFLKVAVLREVIFALFLLAVIGLLRAILTDL
jgi:hypothetical protein